MRSRPYASGSQPPRPYSDVVAERCGTDPARLVLDHIKMMEADAVACTDPAERKRLQCEAEELRCQLAHRPRRQRSSDMKMLGLNPPAMPALPQIKPPPPLPDINSPENLAAQRLATARANSSGRASTQLTSAGSAAAGTLAGSAGGSSNTTTPAASPGSYAGSKAGAR